MKKDYNPTDEKFIARTRARSQKTVMVKEFTPPQEGDIIIMGTYSRTWRNKPHREIREGKALEVNGLLDTPTAHTRDYLTLCYNRRPAKKDQRAMLKAKRMPLYAYPCIMYDAIYIDIKSAWFSIVNRVGWDCEYYPGRWLGRGSAPVDFPLPENKVARSAMVTIGRTTALPIWKDGKLTTQRLYNNLENYHIWGIIADTLNAIATFALEHGARYINTDGFILPVKSSPLLVEYIDDWGLVGRAKHAGDAVICGPGAYHIGEYQTIRVMEFHGIDCVDRTIDEGWLRPRVAKTARRWTLPA